MRYFLVDPDGRPVGPYQRAELALFLDRGLVEDDTRAVAEGATEITTVGEILTTTHPTGEAESGSGAESAPKQHSVIDRAADTSAAKDFLRLAPHLMLPLRDFRSLSTRDNRRILGLAFIGLMPLLLMLYVEVSRNLGAAMWGLALYSSLIWGLFFYVMFSPAGIQVSRSLLTFAGSAIFSIGLVAVARWVIPFQWVLLWINAPSMSTRWAGHLVGVAAIEELAKLFPLYFLWPARLRPRAMMFYGLIAGLGFGIYEGVAYQHSYNLQVSFPDGVPIKEGAGVYYMLNILRLTSLPFLHAMWTGIAGYFLGLAAQSPKRPGGFILAALVVPSLLHATYNAFSMSLAGVMVALVTVIALNLYLFKGQDFEEVLKAPTSPR